jgi:hypothetical protein
VSEERCTVTELMVEQCDHCRPKPAPMFSAPASSRASYSFPISASFESWCITCGDRIDHGDEICLGPDGWIHTDCREE